MKIFKDYPLLLAWMLIITAISLYGLFHVKIELHLDTTEKARVSVKSTTSPLSFKEEK